MVSRTRLSARRYDRERDLTTYRLLPQPQAYGYRVGMLLLDEVETHVPGDTAHAATYDFPVLFKVVRGATAGRVTKGDPSMEGPIVAAAREMADMGVGAISSNCGFMIHYQEAVARAIELPVMLSSLLQLPLVRQAVGPDRRIAILTAFKDRLTLDVLRKAGLPAASNVAIASIQDTVEFRNLALEDLNTRSFGGHLEDATRALVEGHGDVGALVLECAVFTPYADDLRERFGLPVFDFVSLVRYLNSTACHRELSPDQTGVPM